MNIAKNRNRIVSFLTALVMLASFIVGSTLMTGCQASNTTKGGAVGAAGGGAIGAAIGSASDNTALGAIIGAAVGGTAGALIGRRMDKQAEELRADLEGAEVERVGEGIKITFDSGLMFDVDSYNLRPETKANLAELSNTLKKYENTNILIEGHTDATGSDSYNQDLSKQRANAVTSYLMAQGVESQRLTTMGYGETQPIADNSTASGRQQNRRVEVAIYANDKMKKMAERGEL
ncbi:OmpA family protein [Fulvivirga sp. RKSG066]|uniref:OmpA family protein n=1 Tax=Fulvivirga aurantia TaxID=2529383 RepID=UPI0012BC50B0|nr:OmpA family protein [Fulvivirga aurantia]MTI20331.1 OmpA family protein [Fulvivirga aurantia]